MNERLIKQIKENNDDETSLIIITHFEKAAKNYPEDKIELEKISFKNIVQKYFEKSEIIFYNLKQEELDEIIEKIKIIYIQNAKKIANLSKISNRIKLIEYAQILLRKSLVKSEALLNAEKKTKEIIEEEKCKSIIKLLNI